MNHLFLILAVMLCGGDDQPVDFDTEVVPILTRYGCNAGSCHGSAAGRGGFKLSLFGSRPEFDYLAIANQLEGRRVNRSRPNRSLLILKPTGELEHGGEQRFELESDAADRLIRWIKQGANRPTQRLLESFEVSPAASTAELNGQPIQLRAIAKFDDQTERDVTAWTVFEAQDKQSVNLDSITATIQPLRKGRHIVVARFLDRVIPVEVIVPLSGTPIDLSLSPRANFIDDLVYEKLEALRIPVSERCCDEVFFRRICLDLTGTLPEPDELLAFVADVDSDKRGQLIDRLLQTTEFADYWTYQFGQWLRVGAKNQDANSAETYYQWLREQIASNRPLDQIVKSLITSDGDTHQVGPANFYRTTDGARLQAEFVSQALMGSQLRCANCHDHPYDRWTQDDYHGLAAIFASVRNGRVISFDATGDLINPRDGEPAIPKIPGLEIDPQHPADLPQFAAWITRPENPYFAKAISNRIWANFFGRGLVDPVDDLRSTNPATHPELMIRVAEDLRDGGFDLRRTIRLICNSEAYQRSSSAVEGNEADTQFLSHAQSRELPAEVLADAITNVTGVKEAFAGHDAGSKAIQLHKPGFKSELLQILGRCTDEKTCEVGTSIAGGISRQLQMINGQLLNRRITDPSGRLSQLLQSDPGNEKILVELYMRCLTRKPNPAEIGFWTKKLDAAKSDNERIKIYEDLFWSLLTCREFLSK